MFVGEKAYLKPFCHFSFKASLPEALLSEIKAEILGHPVCLSACKTDLLLEYLVVWITCGWLGHPTSTSELSFCWIGYLVRGLPHLWGIQGILLSHSDDIWERFSSQDHLGSWNEFLPPSVDRPLPLCCLSSRRWPSPSFLPQTFDRDSEW